MRYFPQHCFPEYITCWNQTAHLESATCSSKGKGLYEILKHWYSRTHEEPYLQGAHNRIRSRNGKIQAAKSLSRKDCLPYFAGQNGFPHHKQGRAVLYLDIKSSSFSTCKAASRLSLVFQVFQTFRGIFSTTLFSFNWLLQQRKDISTLTESHIHM